MHLTNTVHERNTEQLLSLMMQVFWCGNLNGFYNTQSFITLLTFWKGKVFNGVPAIWLFNQVSPINWQILWPLSDSVKVFIVIFEFFIFQKPALNDYLIIQTSVFPIWRACKIEHSLLVVLRRQRSWLRHIANKFSLDK